MSDRTIPPHLLFPSYYHPGHPDFSQLHFHQPPSPSSPSPIPSPARMSELLSPHPSIPLRPPMYNLQPLERHIGHYLPSRSRTPTKSRHPERVAYLPVTEAVRTDMFFQLRRWAQTEHDERNAKKCKAPRETERTESRLAEKEKGNGKEKEKSLKKKKSEMREGGKGAAKAKASVVGGPNANTHITGRAKSTSKAIASTSSTPSKAVTAPTVSAKAKTPCPTANPVFKTPSTEKAIAHPSSSTAIALPSASKTVAVMPTKPSKPDLPSATKHVGRTIDMSIAVGSMSNAIAEPNKSKAVTVTSSILKNAVISSTTDLVARPAFDMPNAEPSTRKIAEQTKSKSVVFASSNLSNTVIASTIGFVPRIPGPNTIKAINPTSDKLVARLDKRKLPPTIKPKPRYPTASSRIADFTTRCNALAMLEGRLPPIIHFAKISVFSKPGVYRLLAGMIKVVGPLPPPSSTAKALGKVKPKSQSKSKSKPKSKPKAKATKKRKGKGRKENPVEPAPPVQPLMTRKRAPDEGVELQPADPQPGPSHAKGAIRKIPACSSLFGASSPTTPGGQVTFAAVPLTGKRKPRPLPEKSDRVTRSKGLATEATGEDTVPEAAATRGAVVAAPIEEVKVVVAPPPQPPLRRGRSATRASMAVPERGRGPSKITKTVANKRKASAAEGEMAEPPTKRRRGNDSASAIPPPQMEQTLFAVRRITVKCLIPPPKSAPQPTAVSPSPNRPGSVHLEDDIPPPPPSDLLITPTASTSKKRPRKEESEPSAVRRPPVKRLRVSGADKTVKEAMKELAHNRPSDDLVARTASSSKGNARSHAAQSGPSTLRRSRPKPELLSPAEISSNKALEEDMRQLALANKARGRVGSSSWPPPKKMDSP